MSGIRVFFLFACAITISGGPAAAQTLSVEAAPTHAVNSFSPVCALGAGVDRLDLGAADHVFTESMRKEILASGWQPVTYGQNTELHAEAWHRDPKGTWSDPSGVLCSARPSLDQVGQTEITKWQYGKNGAISLTYDDGSINQFRVAVPLMDSFGFPATFFIITGQIPNSRYHGTFIGRPTSAIVEETATVPTNQDNFFERASAIAFLGYQGTADYHTRAGETYDEEKDFAKAYQIIDDGYAKVRQGAFKPAPAHEPSTNQENAITWEELNALAKRGYEFASHTVTHPRVAVLDDANLVYELEKSRQEILDHLGFTHTFSVECPYGTEDSRGVAYALGRFQAARNRMPDSFVEDLDRASTADPTLSKKEYVRWQRGVLTQTPMEQIKSWVDTAATHDNIWLVFVSHGVDGVGWEPKTHQEIKEYLAYVKSKEASLWIATFEDVTKYMRERAHGEVRSYQDGDAVSVVLRDDLTDLSYDLPLTLKTCVPGDWHAVEVRQGTRTTRAEVVRDQGRSYVLYQAIPNAEVLRLVRVQ
jgi:peptidoglycan/xylan/chitin deacetylase (PgdA/CDA1 family)